MKFSPPTRVSADDAIRIAVLLEKTVLLYPNQKGVLEVVDGNDADLEELLLAGFVAEKVKV